MNNVQIDHLPEILPWKIRVEFCKPDSSVLSQFGVEKKIVTFFTNVAIVNNNSF